MAAVDARDMPVTKSWITWQEGVCSCVFDNGDPAAVPCWSTTFSHHENVWIASPLEARRRAFEPAESIEQGGAALPEFFAHPA